MFEFDELTFVTMRGISDDTLGPDTLEELNILRPHYPAVEHWSNMAFIFAWSAYYRDIYAVNWMDWLNDHPDHGFLAYCYVCQRWPDFEFGNEGQFDSDILSLAKAQPWLLSPLQSAPDWIASRLSIAEGASADSFRPSRSAN